MNKRAIMNKFGFLFCMAMAAGTITLAVYRYQNGEVGWFWFNIVLTVINLNSARIFFMSERTMRRYR